MQPLESILSYFNNKDIPHQHLTRMQYTPPTIRPTITAIVHSNPQIFFNYCQETQEQGYFYLEHQQHPAITLRTNPTRITSIKELPTQISNQIEELCQKIQPALTNNF